MIALLMVAALAAEPGADVRPVLSLGLESVVNDPFVYRNGARLGLSADLGRWVSLEASAGGYPVLGRADYNAFTRRLLDQMGVKPDISRVVASGRTSVVAWPVRSGDEHRWTRLGAGAGAALFHTWDELDEERVDDPSSLRQTHPGALAEVRAEAWLGDVGLRVRLETGWYREEVQGAELDKYPTWLGVEALLSPRRESP